MKTEVANIRTYQGRNGIRIDRTTIFGNPYTVKRFGRKKSIAKFKAYFRDRLSWDKHFRIKVRLLEGKTLLCWCKPKACHGDVYVEYLKR